jgi:predicted ArsR family transcriptional regulator
MSKTDEPVSILDRRKIEAQIAGPLIKAFIEEFGEEKTLAVVRKVVGRLARQSGKDLAKALGGNTMADLARGLVAWAKGDAYEMEVMSLSEREYIYNITRCRYAEMYREIGLADLGVILSCGRDFELISGFNPKMKLTRTKTIMEGHDCCDFRITLSGGKP